MSSAKPDFRADWQRHKSFKKFLFILLQDRQMLSSKEIICKAFLPVSYSNLLVDQPSSLWHKPSKLRQRYTASWLRTELSFCRGRKEKRNYLSQDKQQKNKNSVPLNLPSALRVTKPIATPRLSRWLKKPGPVKLWEEGKEITTRFKHMNVEEDIFCKKFWKF